MSREQMIHDAAMEIMRDVGVRIHNPKAVEIFRENGIRVEDNTVYFTEEQVTGAASAAEEPWRTISNA